MRRRTIVALCIGLVAVTACGSTANRGTTVAESAGGSGATVPTEPGGAPVPDATGTTTVVAPGTGSTATPGAPVASGGTASPTPGATGAAVPTGPIEIGFMVAKTSNVAAFGGSLPQTVSEEQMVGALVAQTNAAGGLHGRKIVPVFATTDSASANYDADYAAACAKFTQDDHVEAVLGYVGDESPVLESCLAAKRIPHLSATYDPSDAGTLATKYPDLFELASPTLERRMAMKVDGALADGLLTKQSRLGVVFAGCPAAVSSWNSVAKPAIEAKGVTVASVFETGCPHGAADVTTEVSKIGNLLLQMRTAKVDTMIFYNSDAAALFIIANAAEPQGYRPTYIVSSTAQLATVLVQLPAAQKANVHGFGWVAANDVPRAAFPPFPPAASRCLALLKAGGANPSTSIDYSKSFYFCDALFLFQEAVTATGGRTDGPSVAAAIEGIGARHASAITLDGAATFGPGRHEGVSSARRFDYSSSCQCMAYGTQTVRVP